jgi:pyruvate/2-oxoglutarate dehydrogenase complex dihydrolipoamide acyltransferase (E2) component
MRYEVTVPPTADGSLAVTMGNWLVEVGGRVRLGQDMAEAATEKITLYISAPTDGTLVEILAPKGKVLRIGDLVAIVEGD